MVELKELSPAAMALFLRGFSGRTLYLMPDGLAAQHAYAVLTQVLGQRRKWALGRVVLGGHRVLALVRPCGQLLALHVLHYPEQLRSAEALPLMFRATTLGLPPGAPS